MRRDQNEYLREFTQEQPGSVDAFYVFNVVAHPDKFARLNRPGRVQLTGVISTDTEALTAGKVKKLTDNTSGDLAMVYVEVQPGGNALTGYLYLAKEAGKVTAAAALVRAYGQIPAASILLDNGESLFAYVTSPADDAAVMDVMYTVIPLPGGRAYLGAK